MRVNINHSKKPSFFDRLIDSLWKDPAKFQPRPNSPVEKFDYVLPNSFFRAVDEARLKSGEDILPRLHHMSKSSKKNRLALSFPVAKTMDKNDRKRRTPSIEPNVRKH